MAQIFPLIRVFVSSTFADFQLERNALQTIVFPRLRHYCLEQKARFLPLDLRWGINEAASLEQRTVSTCLDEIRRCQEVSPYFNFIALLGDRYGSRLVPEVIEQAEGDALLAYMSIDEAALFHSWYRLDDNTVPPAYILQSRHAREASWESEHPRLQQVLLRISTHASVAVSAATRLAISASVTEREIDAGIFQTSGDDHAICFLRTIESPSKDSSNKTYFERDEVNRSSATSLKQRLQNRLSNGIVQFTARWHDDAIGIEHINAFCTLVEERLKERIDRALAHQTSQYDTETNQLTSWSFSRRRLASFIGRTEILQRIQAYISSSIATPLVITGRPGIGKTTLMLKSAEETRSTKPRALHLYYFIGGNTAISGVPSLLRDLCARLLNAYPHPDSLTIPDNQNLQNLSTDEISTFLALATKEHPLVLFVDALDQLRGIDITRWIPSNLPPHVRIILSILSGSEFNDLKYRLPHEQVIELDPLSLEQGADLLEQWLKAIGRTLQPAQRAMILERYGSNPNPLYLDLLFQEARHWTSYQEVRPQFAPDIPGMLNIFFESLEDPVQHGALLVNHALGLLAAGKEGLGEDELLDILSQDKTIFQQIIQSHPDSPDTTIFPPVLWARLYADLEPYLTEKESLGAVILGFYHREVDFAAQKRYLSGEDSIARHRNLAHYYMKQEPYLVDTPEQPFAVVNTRMVTELLYQQREGELSDELKYTLLDATFLQACLGLSSIFEVLRYVDVLKDDPDIQKLQQVLLASQRVFWQSTEEVANQIFGRTNEGDIVLHHIPQPKAPRFRLLSRSLFFKQQRQWGPTREERVHAITDCQISFDGRYALSSSSDHTLRLWNVETTELIRVLEGHRGPVRSCAILPDNRHALSTSSDHTLRFWDLQTGKTVHLLDDHLVRSYESFGHYISSAHKANGTIENALLEGGRYVLSASWDSKIQVWDPFSGKIVRTLKGHKKIDEIRDFDASPDGRHILSADRHTMRLWDLQTGKTIRVFRSQELRSFDKCKILPTGTQAVSLSGSLLEVWDLASGNVVRSMQGEYASSFLVTPNGKHALTFSFGKNVIQVWDIGQGEKIETLESYGNSVFDCKGLLDGCHVLSTSHYEFLGGSETDDGELQLWNIQTGKEICKWPADIALTCCSGHPSLPLVIAGDRVGGLHFLRIEPSPLGPPVSLSFIEPWSPDNRSWWQFWRR